MRLINVHTRKLVEVTSMPDYAILSHTWEEGKEVTYQDYVNGKNLELPGYNKIEKCCALARRAGLDWIWCDTCCINKESSSELSEAINSMYYWYKCSKVCFVFLNDLPASASSGLRWTGLEGCRWFGRGWTLQELLAPSWVEFYDEGSLRLLGTKQSLAKVISHVTGIGSEYLLMKKDLQSASVARRMSWAAERSTTRVEDVAYCLLGLFNVNMPLLYGEGSEAFQRLQLEIIAKSSDDSVLAWAPEHADSRLRSGVLATSPRPFVSCNDIHVIKRGGPLYLSTVEKKGILIHRSVISFDQLLRYIPNSLRSVGPVTFATELPLQCGRMTSDNRVERVVLTLQAESGDQRGLYVRNTVTVKRFGRYDSWHDQIATEIYNLCFGPERLLLDPQFGNNLPKSTNTLRDKWTATKGLLWDMRGALLWHIWIKILTRQWLDQHPTPWEFSITLWLVWALSPFHIFIVCSPPLLWNYLSLHAADIKMLLSFFDFKFLTSCLISGALEIFFNEADVLLTPERLFFAVFISGVLLFPRDRDAAS